MLSFILAIIPFLYSFPVFSQAVFLDQAINNNSYSQISFPYSLGPKLTAESALVIDLENGKVCFAKNSTKVLPIASITKLMTSLIFLENRNQAWNEKILVKQKDIIANSKSNNDIEPSELGVRPGQRLILKDVFIAGLAKSANDAMNILARLVNLPPNKNFVDLMNEKAKLLGMSNTVFVDPTGLNPGNQSTAEDLVKLVLAAMKKDEIRQALKVKVFDYPVFKENGQKKYHRVRSTDKLLGSFINLVGAKTGYLEESGYCFAGLSNYENRQLVVIILNADTSINRFKEAKSLVWWTTQLESGNIKTLKY